MISEIKPQNFQLHGLRRLVGVAVETGDYGAPAVEVGQKDNANILQDGAIDSDFLPTNVY